MAITGLRYTEPCVDGAAEYMYSELTVQPELRRKDGDADDRRGAQAHRTAEPDERRTGRTEMRIA